MRCRARLVKHVLGFKERLRSIFVVNGQRMVLMVLKKGLHYVWHVATDAAARETSLLVQKQSFEVHTSFVEDPRSLAVAA